MTEHRSVHAEVRFDQGAADGPHRFWARVLNYGLLDDYNTEWAPGVFNESLQKRMPRLAYGHAGSFDISALVGRGVDWREDLVSDQPGLDVCFEMDDFDAVPSARQFWAQLRSGTIDEFSVGFGRQEDEPSQKYQDVPGARRITKGWLQETSGVLTGAVPGTKLLAMSRSAGAVVDAGLANNVLARLAVGEMDLADAIVELRAAAKTSHRQPMDMTDGGGEDDEDEEDGMCDVAVSDLVELGSAIALLQDGLDENESIPDLVQAVVDAFNEITEDLAEAAGDDDTDESGDGTGGVSADMMARLTERAKWTAAYVNNLPDGAFAYVKPGGTKDDNGRTVPRGNRFFPHHNEAGAVDMPHVRNGLSRVPQSDIPQAAQDRAQAHLQHHLDDPEWHHSVRHAHHADDHSRRAALAALDAEAAAALDRIATR